MTALHEWESVFRHRDDAEGFTSYMNRYRVPNGWLYLHGIMRDRLFRKPELFLTSAFVPDKIEIGPD